MGFRDPIGVASHVVVSILGRVRGEGEGVKRVWHLGNRNVSTTGFVSVSVTGRNKGRLQTMSMIHQQCVIARTADTAKSSVSERQINNLLGPIR